jgi:glycosyltransferase involved in cell wall biosynthesis
MKLAFVNTADIRDVRKYSGTPFYMTKGFENHGVKFSAITHLKNQLPWQFKVKRMIGKLSGLQESSRFNIPAAQNYARQVTGQLQNLSVQAILAHIANPIAYLDCTQPIVLWTDALYAGLLGFIENFSAHSAATVEHANTLTQAALSRVKLAIFSSDWAARSALELYGVSKEKVKVVPFGANFECAHTLFDVRALLRLRSPKLVKLLFLGKEWHRKGGDIVFKVAEALHKAGQPVSVDFVGCMPPQEVAIPPYINCHGFISKHDPAGLTKLSQLMREAHFLFVPSRAEAFGIVFCEANAFGLPCLTSPVGGIGTIIKDNINGMKFALDDGVSVYCDYIMDLMQNYSRYEELALSAFNEYHTRLNWQTSTGIVKQLIAEL